VFATHFQFLNAGFKGYKETSNLQFKSKLMEFQLGTTINISNLAFGEKDRNLSAYGLVGISGLLFRSESWRTTSGEPVHAFGYTMNESLEKSSREFGLGIPLGGGLDFKVNDRWYANLETGLRFTFSDKLDAYTTGINNDAYYYFSLGASYNFDINRVLKPVIVPPEVVEAPEDPFANAYVDLLYFFPEELSSMDEFTMRCKIYKGAIQGRGELTQVLPIGFNVTDTVIGNARVEFKNYTLSLYWDELPTDSIFEITYNVQLDKIYGALPMNSILYLDRTKKEYRFKTEVFIKRKIFTEPIVVEEEIPEEEDMSSPSERVEFRIQVRASYKQKLSTDSLKQSFGLEREIVEEKVGNWYKYSIGSFKTYEEAKAFRREMRQKQHLKDAFIIAYFDDQRLNTLSELKEIAPEVLPGGTPKPIETKYDENGTCYRVQIFALKHKRVTISGLKDMYQIEEDVNEEVYYNWRKYTVGKCYAKAKADKIRKEMISKGLTGAFVVAYKDGVRTVFD